MGESSGKISSTRRIISNVWVLTAFFLCGCGDFFAQKPTEIQSQHILHDIRQIEENPEVKNPLPELYREPAKRIKVKDGIKLFYFTKHHAVTELATLLNEQFATMETDSKGTTTYAPHYAITPNPATNQLIISCPDDQEADKVLEFLGKVDVPPIQVNIDCLILERFADVTTDWETTLFIENFLGERITVGGKTDDAGNLLPNFPGASLRESKRALFGLDVGYWENQGILGHQVRVIVDYLVSRGYLKILMNPTLETINGQKAKILSREYVPLEKILTKAGFDEPFSLTDYQWVEDSLEVTPHVYADGSIGLVTKVQSSSKSKPEGVVQTSVITERTIEIKENRIKPGESLIIGGVRKSVERSVIRGVPFFKDIPVLGVLFSSKDFEESATEVIFILTPSISSGGVEYTEMMEKVRQEHAKPEYETGLHETLTDPFGTGIYTELIEQEAALAEYERFKAELDRAEALEEVGQMKEALLDRAHDVLVAKTEAAKAATEAEIAKQEAEASKAEAERVKAEAAKAKTEAEKAAAEAKKAKEEADKAEAQKAKAEADKKAKEAKEKRQQTKVVAAKDKR